MLLKHVCSASVRDVERLEWRPEESPGLPAVESDGRGPERLADGCREKEREREREREKGMEEWKDGKMEGWREAGREGGREGGRERGHRWICMRKGEREGG